MAKEEPCDFLQAGFCFIKERSPHLACTCSATLGASISKQRSFASSTRRSWTCSQWAIHRGRPPA